MEIFVLDWKRAGVLAVRYMNKKKIICISNKECYNLGNAKAQIKARNVAQCLSHKPGIYDSLDLIPGINDHNCN